MTALSQGMHLQQEREGKEIEEFNQVYHIYMSAHTRTQEKVSDLIPESFNKCNCKNTGPEGAVSLLQKQCLLSEPDVSLLCLHLTPKILTLNQSLLSLTQPSSSFRFSTVALHCNGLTSTYT